MKRLAADFPAYFPSTTYLQKMASADVFVTLDTVPFKAKSIMQRTPIDYRGKKHWLTIPILQKGRLPVKEVQIDHTRHWAGKHRKLLHHAYHHEAYYEFLSAEILQFYSQSRQWLIDATVESTALLCQLYRLSVHNIFSSDIALPMGKSLSEQLVELMRHHQCTCYITTAKEAAFLDTGLFHAHQISIETIDSPSQRHDLSALDGLFKNGPVLPKTTRI